MCRSLDIGKSKKFVSFLRSSYTKKIFRINVAVNLEESLIFFNLFTYIRNFIFSTDCYEKLKDITVEFVNVKFMLYEINKFTLADYGNVSTRIKTLA